MANGNKILKKIVGFADDVIGRKANIAKTRYKVLKDSANFGRVGVPKETIQDAKHSAKYRAAKTFQARVKTGVGVAATTGAGFLGLHKYHQHKDNKILAKIDKLYNKD
jgi:hypothetical protein